jgi:hypothetical protein
MRLTQKLKASREHATLSEENKLHLVRRVPPSSLRDAVGSNREPEFPVRQGGLDLLHSFLRG